MSRRIRVAIVGAGIAGLTAAWSLVRRGFEVRLYEERIYLGGKLGAHRGRFTLSGADIPTPSAPKGYSATGLPADAHQPVLSRDQVDSLTKDVEVGKLPEGILTAVGRGLGKRREALEPPDDDTANLKVKKAARATKTTRPVQFGSRGQVVFTKHGLVPDQMKTAVAKPEPARESRRPDIQGEWQGQAIPRASTTPVKFDITRYRWRPYPAHERQPEHQPAIEVTDKIYHEHCYHLFCNWYRNFWDLMDQIGLERSEAFAPHDELVHLFPGDSPITDRARTLTRLSAVESGADNLLSGAAPVPDLAAWFYSMADLVSQPMNPGRYLDQVSVHTLLRSGWYATEQSAEFHEFLLAKAFAVPPYLSSAYAYQAYINYTLTDPVPMLWALKGNSYDGLFRTFEQRLRDYENFTLALGTNVSDFARTGDRITGFNIRPSDIFGSPRDPDDGKAVSSQPDPVDPKFEADYTILAVPPSALAELAGPLRQFVPGLASVRKLQSGVTAALDLYFTRTLPGIPNSHVVLRGSRYGLTFVDNSQYWQSCDPNIEDLVDQNIEDPNIEDPAHPKEPKDPKQAKKRFTCLNVAITDFYKIDGLNKSDAIRLVIEDLANFIEFDPVKDIDSSRTYLQMNNNEPLFLNEVGSEPWRPGTRTELKNLFLAGDFVENEIGVVCVEGAVVSGLVAARAVQAQAREDSRTKDILHDVDPLLADDDALIPIEVLRPDVYPGINTAALKVMLTPYAVAAKAWARAEEFARHPERALTSREIKASVADMADAPGEMAADLFNFGVEAAQSMAELPFDDKSRTRKQSR